MVDKFQKRFYSRSAKFRLNKVALIYGQFLETKIIDTLKRYQNHKFTIVVKLLSTA